jgi:2-oxoglutarate dehydrogenase E2 component (dihydrolipoamide succinyltransferase)
MPRLGESVVEGTVTRWLRKEGEAIQEFEPLLELNTDKVDTEIPAPATGTVLRVYVAEGETVKAGTLLAFIGDRAEAVPTEGEAEGVAPSTDLRRDGKGTGVVAAKDTAGLGFISPVVARIAEERGIDLSRVRGTGSGGRITKRDVMGFSERRIVAPAPWEQPGTGELFRPTEEVFNTKARTTEPAPRAEAIIPLDPIRRTIAERMVRSKHTSPHVTTVMEADMSRVAAHRGAHQEVFARDRVNLTYSAYFASAAVAALKSIPTANSSWGEQGIVLHPQVHLGIAVSLGDQGLIVPVIREADQKSLLALAAAIQDLSDRARRKLLKPEEVQGGTFTITNHGVGGSLLATPIIHQPQAAILGVGAIQKRVVVAEGTLPSGEKADMMAIRPMVYLTLTFDHRIMDGALADRFLRAIVDRLQTWS